MKVILYMAITANGMIAKIDGNSDWVSPEDTKSFLKHSRDAGVVILGRKAYELFDESYPLPLNKGTHYVMTSNTDMSSDNPTVKFTNQTPEKLIKELENKGQKEACVIGGSITATNFMQKGIIDEIYLDIEPLIFGQGMPLFVPTDFEFNLELLEVKNLSPQTVQLHYKVKK